MIGVLWGLWATPEATDAEPLRLGDLEHFGVEHGLAHSTVYAVHQDVHGFLWFAGESYLQRFDGLELRAFEHDPGDPHSLSESQVTLLVEDSLGRLWLATRGAGVNLWLADQERFVRYRLGGPEDAAGRIFAMAGSPDGAMWLGTTTGLCRLEPGDGVVRWFRHDPAVPQSLGSDLVFSVAADRLGGIWVGDGAGFSRLDPRTGSFTHFRHDPGDSRSVSSNDSGTVFEDSAGNVWLGTWDGRLNRHDPETGGFERFDPAPGLEGGRGIHTITEDAAGDLWLALESRGVIHLDRASETFTRFEHDPGDPSSLSSTRVRDVLEDRSGVVWFASENGLDRWVRQRDQFSVWRGGPPRAPRSLPGAAVSALYEDSRGRLWVGTQEGGLGVYEGERPVKIWPETGETGESRPSGMIRALHEDAGGGVWVGSDDGLWHRAGDPGDPGRPAAERAFRAMAEIRAVTALARADGSVWAGTSRGLFRIDPLDFSSQPVPLLDSGPRQTRARRVYGLAAGSRDLFVVTEGGFFRVETATGTASEIGQIGQPGSESPGGGQRGPSSSNLVAIHRDSAAGFWLGSYGGGLNHWQPELDQWTHFHVRDGLPSDKVVAIVEAEDGDLWLGTNGGLSRFDPESRTFRNYDFEDGLHGNITFIGSALQRRDGALVFGGPGGLTSFFPGAIRDDPRAPAVVLTRLLVNDEPILPAAGDDPASPLERSILLTPELTLNHRHRTLALEFAALHYANPRRNRYAYRLEGYDEDWVPADPGSRRARYTNLDAGDYTFTVKASNKDGVWNQEGRRLRIRILPPPWQTGWAYTLYVLALIAVVAGAVYRQRAKLAREQAINHRLRQVDRLKDEFLANTSHELRTPLQGITGLAESLLYLPEGELSTQTRGDLELLMASARRLGVLVDDLLDFSKLDQQELKLDRRPVDLYGTAQVVLTLTRPLVDEARVELVNDVDPELPPVDADEHRLVQVLHNLVGNAVKFTPEGFVRITAHLETEHDGEMLCVEVTDSGIGVPEDQRESIFEPFRQVDGTTDRRFGGTGLGLAVSRQLVELHGGHIGIRSGSESGSVFYFTLPLAAGEAAGSGLLVPELELPARRGEVPRPAEDSRGDVFRDAPSPTVEMRQALAPGAAPDQPPRILVVDDEPINRRVLARFLDAEGYDIDIADGGESALRALEHRSYDLILLDIMMPKISGYDVCRQVRLVHPLGELPIIFLSAKIQPLDVVTGFSLGANDFLLKPITKAELLARIQPHLALLEINRALGELVDEKISQIKVLGGLLPICAICKNIRDDDGYWANLESFISDHSEATFSHGMCPSCYAEHFSELAAEDSGGSRETE